ncbi:MAG: hypothetical protein JSW34_09755 [Candidatus Zixiibacteriota bacterium]|nr:MAG: hypothetical protein JSW34_09755 [candidate division Zixibacteria bacterium]
MKSSGQEICAGTIRTDCYPALATTAKSLGQSGFRPEARLGRVLSCASGDILSGRYRIQLYRFLTQNVPVVNACISTWVRLSAAPGNFRIDNETGPDARRAREKLAGLCERVYRPTAGNAGSMVTFLSDLFGGLYRDGVAGGFITVKQNGTGVDRFIPVDVVDLLCRRRGAQRHLMLELDSRTIDLDRSDFYHIPLNADINHPLGRSVLQPVPFVAYIEQQLVDDMRRTSHNSGFHRLHVKVTPPERMAGEADNAYTDRINSYFDSTVTMIKSCEVDDNPVTWDNVAIEHIGPSNVRTVTNSWFLNHRSMIEEVCAGTGLAPFLLGYSYGATATWSSFKFDLVMRQVRSIQTEVAAFLQWLGNIELALAGLNQRCRFEFDNTFAYQAAENARVQSSRVDSLLKLYNAGLIDRNDARRRAGDLI